MRSLSNFQWHFSKTASNTKICVQQQNIPNSQSNLEKEQSQRHHTSWLYTINYGSQNSITVAQNRCMDQWNRAESTEINSCIYGQLIYDKWAKIIQWLVSPIKLDSPCKKMKQDDYLTPYTKINAKWIKDLNIIQKPKTPNRNIGKSKNKQVGR